MPSGLSCGISTGRPISPPSLKWMNCAVILSIATRCIATARSRFDLESIGGERYCRLYHRLLGSPEHALAGAVDR